MKSLSETRWSAKDDACKSLNENWSSIINALSEIEHDEREKTSTQSEARGITKKLCSPETGFLSMFWGNILERFNAVSKKLQSANIDLDVVVELYNSLIVFVSDFLSDEAYEHFESLAVKTTDIKNFKNNLKCKKMQKKLFDEKLSEDPEINDAEIFKVDTYFVILDKLIKELEKGKNRMTIFLKTINSFLK